MGLVQWLCKMSLWREKKVLKRGCIETRQGQKIELDNRTKTKSSWSILTSSWIPWLRSSAAWESPASSTRGEGAERATNASLHQFVFWQRTITARCTRARFAERTRSSHDFWQAAACTICEKGRARRASGRGERREEWAGTSSVMQKKFQVMRKCAFFSPK